MIQTIFCPICGKPATDGSKTPFCSARCRTIDFHRWWEGKYEIVEQGEVDPPAPFGKETSVAWEVPVDAMDYQ